ncbi:MAG: fatty acid--CoA ligase family protein [Jatrophihabitans sp.]
MFTSGTTGRAKGATHSHRNFIGACWFHLLNDAVATELGQPLQPGRRYLLVSPLFHISSLHNLAVIRLVTGDAAVIYQGKFEPDRVLSLIERQRVTNWGGMPTLLTRIVEYPELDRFDLSSLRTVSISSAPSSPALKNRVRDKLPLAARSLGTTYGLTESSTAVTVASAGELLVDPATVGRAVPTMQVRICDESGVPVPDGAEGEICLLGPLVMVGYWRDPEATARATTPDGWFRTGDLGTMRDGALSMSSRRSDLILRGAENVYPAEVESQLADHPGVRDCVVLGVPHADLGEEVAAVVVTRSNIDVDEAELREFLSARLGRYKIPTRWMITTRELPRNATGKVKRREINWPDDA